VEVGGRDLFECKPRAAEEVDETLRAAVLSHRAGYSSVIAEVGCVSVTQDTDE
jgi:hypothetical protein